MPRRGEATLEHLLGENYISNPKNLYIVYISFNNGRKIF